MIKVSVLIPTFRRPDCFIRAARSVFRQQGVENVELVAIDNSPEGSALDAFRALDAEAPFPFRWAHAPKPGVAQARNVALALARGELIAWLDDDEEASPRWLAALIAVRKQTGAQSVFGPVRAQAPANVENAVFFEDLYSRRGPHHSGPCRGAYGIGNSLQPRAMFDNAISFDPRADQTGGEDDALFASWAEAGATFAWAADAIVVEHLGPERMRVAHGLKRAFAYGQGPCETAWSSRNYASLARHMSTGAAQAVLFGAASALVVGASKPHALAMLDQAARGAGKVFWFFEQRFYGEALLDQPARRKKRSIAMTGASAPV
jgi:succinoglycan biosynthesis protein ExoM